MKKVGKKLLTVLAGIVVGGAAVGTIYKKRTDAANEALKKSHRLYSVFDQWLTFLQEGKSLEEYFKQNNYKTVAIYGMRELGEHLYDELKDSDITVKYVIDKNADAVYTDVDVVTPDDHLERVDVIIVTAVYYFEEIKEMLETKVDYAIVSLEDIIRTK